MNRVSGITAGLLCLAGCWSAFAATGPDADPVATAISAELDALMNPEVTTVHGAQVALRERLQDYYSRREFRAAWSNAHTAQQLLQALADSHEDGLDPADYHLPLLKELAAQVAAPQATATLKAQYDLLLTEALLRLSYHLSFGKVDPESFDAKWNYGRTLSHLDVSKEIDAAISSDQVYERIAALKPKHFLYVRLKQELVRHRVMEKAGGWSALPAGPALKPGVSDARIPALRSRLILSGDLTDYAAPPDPELYDATLVEAVKQYQQRAGLEADGAVGPGTIKQLNIPVTERILQLRVNLDRGRLLLQDLPAEFVVVNIAGYSVYLVRGEDIVWSARAQVGKAYRRTPLFRSEITYLVWNPTWTVPPGIIRNDILPAARKDPSSITRRGLRVLDASGREVSPESVDWSQFSSGHIPYTLRQDPGPKNALGRVKLMFPNPYQVYLHDTPSQALFESAQRAFSSGCVRVERAPELARLLLDDPQTWSSETVEKVIAEGHLRSVTLKKHMPVLLTYWTAWVDPLGKANFRDDIYGQDEKWIAGLNAPFKIRARPVFSDAEPATPE